MTPLAVLAVALIPLFLLVLAEMVRQWDPLPRFAKRRLNRARLAIGIHRRTREAARARLGIAPLSWRASWDRAGIIAAYDRRCNRQLPTVDDLRRDSSVGAPPPRMDAVD